VGTEEDKSGAKTKAGSRFSEVEALIAHDKGSHGKEYTEIAQYE